MSLLNTGNASATAVQDAHDDLASTGEFAQQDVVAAECPKVVELAPLPQPVSGDCGALIGMG
jgi:hypothetical protein